MCLLETRPDGPQSKSIPQILQKHSSVLIVLTFKQTLPLMETLFTIFSIFSFTISWRTLTRRQQAPCLKRLAAYTRERYLAVHCSYAVIVRWPAVKLAVIHNDIIPYFQLNKQTIRLGLDLGHVGVNLGPVLYFIMCRGHLDRERGKGDRRTVLLISRFVFSI